MSKMLNKKLILTLIMTILHAHSMFIGQYSTPYNALTPILKQEYATCWPDVSGQNFLRPATVAQLNDSLSNDCMALTLGVGIFGQPVEADVPDKTLNVVYHNLVRDWLISTEGFNPLEFSVNAQIGIFEPNGITTQISTPATVGALSSESVSIHGDGNPENCGIYYSPNNVRFKIDDDRQLASFWSVAVSPDNQNAALNFNLIIFNQPIADQISEYIANNIPLEILFDSIPDLSNLSEPDQRCLLESLNLIARLAS
jgi:hypothetical protein